MKKEQSKSKKSYLLQFLANSFQSIITVVQELQEMLPLGSESIWYALQSQKKKELKHLLELELSSKVQISNYSTDEKNMIDEIRKQTMHFNRNNVTRTKAYLDLYQEFPEIHWAFLAHMVSRNGGWSMTDLKGDLLPQLLDQQKRNHFFLFLETCNAYIFQDAYPQLLLYKKSRQLNKNLSYLLPAFHVSRFMKPFWDHFWESKDSALLTIALIINEQNYIEKRVVQHPTYKEIVTDTIEFSAQSILQLTQVIFPYFTQSRWNKKTSRQLTGVTVSQFKDLSSRIEVGKKLYFQLFGIQKVYKGAHHFANHYPHTGSRADYWPHLFSKIDLSNGKTYGKERLKKCKLQNQAPPFYSPPLANAWEDIKLQEPARFDWFSDLTPIHFLDQIFTAQTGNMNEVFCSTLNKIELAVLAKQKVL